MSDITVEFYVSSTTGKRNISNINKSFSSRIIQTSIATERHLYCIPHRSVPDSYRLSSCKRRDRINIDHAEKNENGEETTTEAKGQTVRPENTLGFFRESHVSIETDHLSFVRCDLNSLTASVQGCSYNPVSLSVHLCQDGQDGHAFTSS